MPVLVSLAALVVIFTFAQPLFWLIVATVIILIIIALIGG